MNKTIVRQGLPILLAAGFLWYVLKDISLSQLADQFHKANYGLLVLVVLLVCVFYIVRAARWQITLRAIGYNPPLFRATVALLAGSLASMIIPGAGELTRCGSLQRTDGIPISQGIGSVVAERIIDLLMLLLLLAFTVILEFSRMNAYFANLTIHVPSTYLLITGLLLAALLAISTLFVLRTRSLRDHPIVHKLKNLFEGFTKGLLSIGHLPQPRSFIVLTLMNQALPWLTTYILLLAVDDTQNLPPSAALTILAVSSLGGLAVPTQGGIGTYHFFVSRALVLYGFTLTQGAIVATFLHAVGFGINLVLSSVSFLIVPLLIASNDAKPAENTAK